MRLIRFRRSTAALLVLFMLAGLVLATGHIEKPTGFTDADGTTSSAADAFDFPDVYNENTSATTTDPAADPAVTWHTWDTGGAVYEDLSLTVTLSSAGFSVNTWALYYDNSTDTTCDSTDRVLKTSGADNLGLTNISVPLPSDQTLSDIQVCISGSSTLSEGATIDTFDIRTNGTIDTAPPRWRDRQQNDSTPALGDAVELAAQGRDSGTLDAAVLATNESGTWRNITGNYSSPRQLGTSETWTWSNFTWSNSSLSPGTTVAWRIHYNDTAGNHNATDTGTFTVEDAVLDVALDEPPSPFTIGQNATFTVNATVTCTNADCGTVDGTARYNASAEPDTAVPSSGTPFTTPDANPQTCAASLPRGGSCTVSWTVNATGDIGSTWLLDVEATSDVAATSDSGDAEVAIASRIVDVRLHWDDTAFGTLFPGTTDNPALNNSDDLYDIEVTDRSTVDVALWINGSDLLQEDGGRRIGVGNVSWNTAADPSTATALAPTFSRLRSPVSPGTNTTAYFWLDVPRGLPADNYTGTLTVKANATA